MSGEKSRQNENTLRRGGSGERAWREGPPVGAGITPSFQRANRLYHTIYVTGLVDLEARRVVDMVKAAAVNLRKWTANADPAWIKGIEAVATDLAQSFRAELSMQLDHDIRVADFFRVVRVVARCLDAVRHAPDIHPDDGLWHAYRGALLGPPGH
jgi:hypothetical protein